VISRRIVERQLMRSRQPPAVVKYVGDAAESRRRWRGTGGSSRRERTAESKAGLANIELRESAV
jgi:hypothetical protein